MLAFPVAKVALTEYNPETRRTQVGVILVEEAGEVLEAHVLAALTPATKQLIMIGDHLQLRPKVESYNLTVSGGKVRRALRACCTAAPPSV